MLKKLLESGKRISVEAEEMIKTYKDPIKLISYLSENHSPFITKDIVSKEIEKIEKEEEEKGKERNEEEGENNKQIVEEDTQVNKEIKFSNIHTPLAKEYDADIKIMKKMEKSKSKGEIEDFIEHFRDRFRRMSKLFIHVGKQNLPLVQLNEIKKYVGSRVKIITMVYSKKTSKKGNYVLNIEDLTGSFLAIASKYNEVIYKKASTIVEDDIVMITGKVLDAYIIIDSIEFPDIPITHNRRYAKREIAIAYLSDTHFGSKYFLEKYINRFLDWIKGKINVSKDIRDKLKYIIIAGDVVDGVGVYPGQEKELIVKDIEKQYSLFNEFVEKIPDYIEVLIIPGNHDAVRRAEPTPEIPKEYITGDIKTLWNPSWVKIEGVVHLLYHGTSFDSAIARIPKLSYEYPEHVMKELLKRRHISPFYGGNLIVPEHADPFIIEDVPDVFHAGHVHKNGYLMYRNTLVINSGTFQDRTPFQIKQGHIPTPGLVPVYEMHIGKLKTFDFTS